MELVYHLGLVPGPDITFTKVRKNVWALGVMGFLIYIAMIGSVARRLSPVVSFLLPSLWEWTEAYAVQLYWALVAALVKLHPMKVNIVGDQINADSAVVLCNHQSLADYFFMVHLAQTLDTPWTPQVNFFTWYTLWRVPTLRIARNVASCDENWDLSLLLCQAMFKRVLELEKPEWVVLFPEVNIRTPAVAYAQRVQGRRFFLPVFDNVLYPRFPGLLNTLLTLHLAKSVKFTHLYDVTVLFGDNPPSLLDLFADAVSVTIHVRRVDISLVPEKRAKLERWLEDTWTQKDDKMSTLAHQQE